jgi:hypothetical protein
MYMDMSNSAHPLFSEQECYTPLIKGNGEITMEKLRPQNENGIGFATEKENSKESHAESIAQAKLERLLADDFSDFAIRFMNFSEYEELLQNKRFRGGNAYSPKRGRVTEYAKPPTFKQYLEEGREKGWQRKISDDVDWPQGTMSIFTYDDLMKILQEAKNSVTRENVNKEDYTPKILNEMRSRLNAEIQNERLYRDPLDTGRNLPFAEDPEFYDYIKQEYDIFFFAFSLPEIPEIISSKKKDLKALLKGKGAQEILDFTDTVPEDYNFYHKNAYVDRLSKKIISLNIEPSLQEEVLTVSKELSHWIAFMNKNIKKFGGKENLDLIRKWFENPESVELRSFINAVVSGQIHWIEDLQYQVALVIDSKGFRKNESKISDWGGVKPGSIKNILGVISLIPGKEWLEKITQKAKNSEEFSHPAFDNKGVVKFPKQKSE